jgi:hypothetical protein
MSSNSIDPRLGSKVKSVADSVEDEYWLLLRLAMMRLDVVISQRHQLREAGIEAFSAQRQTCGCRLRAIPTRQ